MQVYLNKLLISSWRVTSQFKNMQNSTVCLISAASVTSNHISTECSICANNLQTICRQIVLYRSCSNSVAYLTLDAGSTPCLRGAASLLSDCRVDPACFLPPIWGQVLSACGAQFLPVCRQIVLRRLCLISTANLTTVLSTLFAQFLLKLNANSFCPISDSSLLTPQILQSLCEICCLSSNRNW